MFISGNCILYTYDGGSGNTEGIAHEGNGGVDADEYYGFRLSGSNIQMRLSGSATNACNIQDDFWNALNVSEGGEQIEVTLLTFTPSFKCLRKRVGVDDLSYGTACSIPDSQGYLLAGDRVIETREITITMTGQVKKDTTVTKNIMDHVKIRNDRVFVKP